ncbi:MAG: ABC transporter permease [Candidatus Cloacimonetes bacterium]|nr:ABC transporter permease [Candidatus Cloacimonadota bacterium]
MIKNYFKIAIRNLAREKVFSAINIIGLAIGLACGILLSLWIFDEISFDKFHENGENIYRVLENQSYSSQNMKVAVTPAPMAESIKEDFPEIVGATRYNESYAQDFKVDEKVYSEIMGAFADEDFLRMFSFPIIKGDQAPLSKKNSIVITEGTAKKLFKDEEALGRNISLYDNNFEITAIIQNVPENSHISFDYLLPFQIMVERNPDIENWGSNSIYTYIHLAENTSQQQFSEKIQMYLKEQREGASSELYLQPIFQTHLHSVGLVADMGGMGDFRYIILFSIIAVFIIIISSVNFISLSTARYTKRAKEVGLRKVVGSQRSQLIWQFLGESMLLLLISLVVALVLVEFFMPAFNNISAKQLSLLNLLNPEMMAGLVAFVIILGFLTGIYPAFMLSSFKPVTILKGSQISGSKGSLFRKIIVVTQWSLSIILIISTLMISKQLKFMKNKKLGFEKEQIVYTDIRGFDKYDELKEELLKNPEVESVSATKSLPNRIMSSASGSVWEGKNDEETFLVHYNIVDYDFIETFKIEMAEGRSFSEEFSDEENFGVLLNEEAIKQMGLEDPIGKEYSFWGNEGEIVGVMKDFHFKSLHNPIEPMLFMVFKDYVDYLVVRIGADDPENTIAYLEQTMNKFEPESNHEFRFFDERYNAMYHSEQEMEMILKIFTILAIFIACLGLFGLSTFMTQQRTKEIGIRKVLGANVPNIVIILSKEFTKWVIIANLIACPVAYFILNSLLQNFAYRISIGYQVFGITIVLSILIAIITVSFQTFKAANSNPVKALKYE